ncbi:hypothetical protein SK128_026709 [Halocaridina rubra]|uniref:Uncharacterized protein n=1 Tax=Halocaridina rubra TaxID=373956 RepID=A0AAN9AEH3_HALRR
MKVIRIFSIFVVITVAGAIECSNDQEINGKMIMSFPSENFETQEYEYRVCLRPNSSSINNGKMNFEFGQRDSGNFILSYEISLKGRSKNGVLQYAFKEARSDKEDMDGRIMLDWISSDNWTCLSLINDRVSFHFEKGDQALDIQLQGVEIKSINEVSINTDLQIAVSTNCVQEIETLMELNISSEATAGTSTETSPVTVEATSPVTVEEYSTIPSTLEVNVSITSTYMEESTTDPSDIVVPVAVQESYLENEDCDKLPFWVWISVGLMAVFILLFFVLLIYTIVLVRRQRAFMTSTARQCDFIRGGFTPPGGYGQQVGDLQYFKTENQSVVAIAPHPISAHNTQTLQFPQGSVVKPSAQFYTSPRTSVYARSISCPSQQDCSEIAFPPPPSTPPPVARPETVPVFCPSGSNDDVDHSYKKGKHSARRHSSKRQTRQKGGTEADDENSNSDGCY